MSADDLLGIDEKLKEIQDTLKEAKKQIFYSHYAKAEKLLLCTLKRFPKRYDVMEQRMLLCQMKRNDDRQND